MSDDPELLARRRAAAGAARTSLFGHGPMAPAKRLATLATTDLGSSPEQSDVYGSGGVLSELEAEIADLLEKPAAAFMPSGVMAQQCVLRVWSDRAATKRVALHALSHLVMHELSALELVHGLHLEHLSTERRPATVADLAALPGQLAAVSIELPLREAAHRLPTWSELEELAAACRERGVPLHIDGARLWESAPYWGRELRDVAALADTVYVSFYKSLGALACAAVAGPQDVIDEARRWQKRHGGTLVTLLPYAVSARDGLRTHGPRMAEYHAAALELAAGLVARGVTVEPDPPHTNAFRIYVPCTADEVNDRLLQHLEAEHEAVTPWFRPADVPGWAFTELMAGAATCALGPKNAAERVAGIVLG